MSRIDEYLKHKDDDRKIRLPNYYYVTDLTKPCIRQAYYDIVEDRTFPIETLRIFEAGNILEDYWVTILEKTQGISVLNIQTPAYYIDDDIIIHGRVDALTQHDDNRIVAHEIKTASSCHWMKKPKPEHVQQLQFYLYCLNIEDGVIDYLDKGAFLKGKTIIDLSFPVKKDKEVAEQMIKHALTLKNYVDNKTTPMGNSEAWNGRICDYCLYNDLCDTLPRTNICEHCGNEKDTKIEDGVGRGFTMVCSKCIKFTVGG